MFYHQRMQKCPEKQGNQEFHQVKKDFFPLILGPLQAPDIGNRDINELFKITTILSASVPLL